MSDNTKGYEVGYGKTPKHTRFKPGQSGNPKGKPKQIKTLPELIAKELKKKIIVVENGVSTKVTKAEALAKSLVQQALQKDKAAAKLVMSCPQPDVEVTTSSVDWSEQDLEILACLLHEQGLHPWK